MATETLTWTYPTQRTDGSALAPTDTLIANVFDSLSPTPSTPIGTALGNPGGKGTFTTPALPNGKNDFTVTITDGAVTSAPSNVFEVDIEPPPAPPAAVTDLSGTANP